MARILVVDDVKFISKMLAEILRKEGHEVETADDGQSAIDHVTTMQPDLLLMDIAMPGVDGLEVTRRLKAEPSTRHIPIMIVSSRNDEKTIAEAEACGVDDFVVKPFETPSLLIKVGRLLGGSRMNFSTEIEDAIPVVTVLHPEVTGEIVAQLYDALETARSGAASSMVLDLSRVTKAASEVPDVVNAFADTIRAAGGKLEVVRPGKGIGTSAIASKLNERVGAHDEREAALVAARTPDTAEIEAGSSPPRAPLAAPPASAESPMSLETPEDLGLETPEDLSLETPVNMSLETPEDVRPEPPVNTTAPPEVDIDPPANEELSVRQDAPAAPEESAAPETPADLQTEIHGKTALIRVQRRDLDAGTLRQLERAIVPSELDLLLEMSRVKEISSADLARLATFVDSVQSSGRSARIINPEPGIVDDLRAGGLGSILFRTKEVGAVVGSRS